MIKPTTEITYRVKANGNFGRKMEGHSYVAVLCQQDGEEVKAARMDYYVNQFDARKAAIEMYPGYNVKFMHRLYDEDFEGGK